MYTSGHVINPGLRGAVDVGQLQIVPGVSAPVTFADGASHVGVLFYLSFEHPF